MRTIQYCLRLQSMQEAKKDKVDTAVIIPNLHDAWLLDILCVLTFPKQNSK